MKGHHIPHSEETKKKISKILKEKHLTAWNKGKPAPWAKNLPQQFKKGRIAPHKNQREKQCLICNKTFSVSPLRERIKLCSRKCKADSQRGKKPWNWKGEITTEIVRLRYTNEYKLWRTAVFARDNWTCIWCFQKGGRLEADHIKSFALYPELRFAIDNGRTLCILCHRTTDTYGGKSKTKLC